MPTVYEQYVQELAHAHREAIQALRELLAAATDPTERRRLANAILKARPIKPPQTSASVPAPRQGGAAVTPSTSSNIPQQPQPARPTGPARRPLNAPVPALPALLTAAAGTDTPPAQTQKPRRESPGGGSSAAA